MNYNEYLSGLITKVMKKQYRVEIMQCEEIEKLREKLMEYARFVVDEMIKMEEEISRRLMRLHEKADKLLMEQ